jgi:phosphinothricin acetyltransferase
MINIRDAKIEDIDRINEIYNDVIHEKFKVAYLMPWTRDMRLEWFKELNNENYPICVAEIDNNVIGFVFIHPYRKGRTSLKQTAEISYFIDNRYRRMGIGKKLIEHIESKCCMLGIKTLFAIIIDINVASIRLIEKCGYEQWGHLPKIALFDNVEVGHFYFGKRIVP